MDKILFIVPPNIDYDNFVNPPDNVKRVSKRSGNFGAVITDIPLGILSLSAYVKKFATTEMRLVDFNCVLNKLESFDFPSFIEFFKDYLSNPDIANNTPSIIGISVLFTPAYRSMLDIAQCCRDIFPNAIIIAGGGRANKYV